MKKPSNQEKIEKIARAMSLDPEYFSDWESRFVDGLIAQHYPLTESQLKSLELLWQKNLKR